MHGHDGNPIPGSPQSEVTLPFYRTLGFRFALLGAALVALVSVVFILFFSINTRLTYAVSQTVQAQSDYQAMYVHISNVDTLLGEMLNTASDEKTDIFQILEALDDSLTQLDTHFSGVHVQNLAMIVREYISAAYDVLRLHDQAQVSQAYEAYARLTNIRSTITLYSSHATQDVNMLVLQEIAQLNKQAQKQMAGLGLVLGMVLAITVAMMAYLLFSLIRSIHRLTLTVTSVVGDRSATAQLFPRQDEMGVLQRAFLDMLDSLEQKQNMEMSLLKERERAAVAERRLAKNELILYQSQINAHFLFNSLNIVAKLAYQGQAAQAQEAAELIARFLRAALTRVGKTCQLRQEFSCVRDYMSIQKLRFGDRLAYTECCDEACAFEEFPSMILQPLVENAMIHGADWSRPPVHIRAFAHMQGNRLFLGVEDDGTGLSPQAIESLKEKLLHVQPDDEDPHIGLRNIYLRLTMHFPGGVCPIVQSDPGERTVIGFEVTLPPGDFP